MHTILSKHDATQVFHEPHEWNVQQDLTEYSIYEAEMHHVSHMQQAPLEGGLSFMTKSLWFLWIIFLTHKEVMHTSVHIKKAIFGSKTPPTGTQKPAEVHDNLTQTHTKLKKGKLIAFTLPGMLHTKGKALTWWRESREIYWAWMPVIQTVYYCQ